MKAFIYTKYGPPEVLQVVDREMPSPKPNQVLIKIRAASINALDYRFRSGRPYVMRLMFGLHKPSILPGRDVSGTVEAVGKEVKTFKPGDEVFGVCHGSFAGYSVADERQLAIKPPNVTFEETAATPIAALTALQGLRDYGEIQSGEQVLIDGAGGGVGTFAVQIARAFNTEVTAVCGPNSAEVVKALAPDSMIDYTKDHFNRYQRRYDLILAVNGYHSLLDYKMALKPKGTFVFAGGSMTLMFKRMILAPWISIMEGKKMRGFIAKANASDFDILGKWLESGKIKPVIDRQYPMSALVDAMRYVDKGHIKGKVVLVGNLS